MSPPIRSVNRNRLLAGRSRLKVEWIDALGKTHDCDATPEEQDEQCRGLGHMLVVIAWAWDVPTQLVSELIRRLIVAFGVCGFCLARELLTSPEPGPPLWFRGAFDRAFDLENPDEPDRDTQRELARYLTWAGLASLGVRSREQVLHFLLSHEGLPPVFGPVPVGDA